MPTVGIRELSRNASKVIEDVQRTKRPYIVTRNGEPVVVLSVIDPEQLEDFLLANAPEFVEGRREADEELRTGRTRSLSAFLVDEGDSR